MFEGVQSVYLFAATLRMATPLILASTGAMFSELSGVTNLGIEGMMLCGAFAGSVITYLTQNVSLGILAAIVAGGLMAGVHALFSVRYKADQIVTGIAINIFASGITQYLLALVFGSVGNSKAVSVRISAVNVPLLSKIPVIGPVLNGQLWVVYLALVLPFMARWVVYHTAFGLRIRAAGELPEAVATAGIRVNRLRYIGVIISGLLAGLAGAYLSIGLVDTFRRDMTAGRGYIALAALILGKWKPLGVLAAAIFFGFADALQMRLQMASLPVQFIQMVPYLVTIIALAGVVGKSRAPSAINKPYEED
ncbi:MAG: ABC transporter permease [Firmicutes bacterium]|nr:ABC transporter permease [Bacillota bacterium]